MILMNPLNNKEFLDNLFAHNEREISVKITVLDFNEQPIECIEGKAIDGTINVDGTSAVRRTCNLTIVAEEIDINEFYWGLKNKFKLEIGLKNDIDPLYPEIIWFKQGIFVITQFNTIQTTKKWTIKIQGKDKMCLLNGDISGNLSFNVDFSHEQYYNKNTNTYTYNEVPIKTIINRALIEFGKELPYNIILNDIDEIGRELLEYRGLSPLYIFKDVDTEEYRQISIKEDLKCYYELKQELTLEQYKSIPEDYSFLLNIYVKNLEGKYVFNNELANQDETYQKYNHNGWFEGRISDNFNIVYDDLLEDSEFVGGDEPTIIRFNLINPIYANKRYYIIKINTGEIPGYRLTDLTFAGELKASIGESITSILDKIKNKFTNFEYFYNIDGKFVFQKKREYLTTAWDSSNAKTNLLYNGNDFQNEILFNFIDGKFITSFQNTPKLTDVKNDYSVWGTRDKTTLHMRYAIDNKPVLYCPIRPLKEKIIHIYWDTNKNYIKEKESYKFYDAPEIEPYNDNGLKVCDYGYQFLLLILKNSNNNIFNLDDYSTIENLFTLCPNYETQWLSLFVKQKDKFLYDFTGNYEDIKNIFIILNQAESINGHVNEITILTSEDGSEEWIINFQYFAKYYYGINNVVDENNNIIHYKVDWRELIYQMALDYRKLNYTDDFVFYLKSANPDLIKNNKTNYEQYYTDIEGFWRYLYNPNPELMFEPITSFEVQKETLLLDNNSENDFLDQIYIKNPYVSVTEDNIDSITQDNLYRYTKAEKSDLYGIYPFVPSDKHHLQLDIPYFIESTLSNDSSDVVMSSHKVETPNSNIPKIELQPAYNTLNNVDVNKIYIKNDQDFITRKASYIIPSNIYQKNVFYIQDNNKNYIISQDEYDEKVIYYKYASNQYKEANIVNEIKNVYQPGKYYVQRIDSNNCITYVVSADKFNNNEIYYELYWNGNYEDKFYVQPDLLFKVPYYPYISTLKDSVDSPVVDYMLFTEQEFKVIKDNLDSCYYFKNNNNYIKLSECLKDINMSKLYYCSDLYNLSYQTNNILAVLNLIHENVEKKYNTKCINYIEEILKNLENYNDIIQYKNFQDIKENLIFFMLNIFTEYKQKINIFLNDIINNGNADNSSLIYLADIYNNNIMNINVENNLTIDYIIYLIREINIQLQNLINNINSYYNQVAIVLNYKNTLIPTENQESYTLTQFKADSSILLLTLNSIKEYYENGQLQKTIQQLESIIKNIDNNSSYTLQNAQKDFEDILLFNINQMTDCLNNLELLILTDIFNYNNTSVYNTLLLYMQHLGKLYQIFKMALSAYNFNEGKNNLIATLTFDSNIISLQELYDNIKKCTDLKTLQNIVLNYEETTKTFQEFFIQENINNFNILKDNKINFESIEYQRGFYNYKHTYEEGNYWLLDIYNAPQSLLFWFDFLEPNSGNLTKYSVPLIGSRTKVISDKDVKSMHYKDIPNIIFKSNSFSKDSILPGYNYINITDSFMNLFNISSKSKTAKERIDELLYKHSHCAENINIQVIPVYNLEPNNKIYIQDHECNIQGDYLINKITIPLSYKKMMTITALKAIDESI